MAEEIRLDVVAKGHNKGLDDTSRALRGVKADSDKLGESFSRTTKETFDLDRAIEEAREEIHRIQEEVKRTGDRALLGDLRRQKKDLDDFMRLAGQAAGAAGNAAGRAMDFGREGMRPRNALILALVSAVAAAAPGIGAMLSGIVAGAIGTGGVAAGIAMASKDPRVRSAASDFGDAISAEFFRGGDAFVQPTIAALAELQDAFMDMKVPESVAKLAPLVDEIARGFGDAGRRGMEGFNEALDRMGPFADVAERGIADIGGAIGDFADLTTQSEGSVVGLDLAFRTVSGSIRIAGAYLKVFSDMTDAFATTQATAFGSISGMFRGLGLDGAADAAARWSSVWLSIGKDLPTEKLFKIDAAVQASTAAVQAGASYWEAYATQVRAVNDALKDAIRQMLDQDNATLGLQSAMLDLRDSIKENGREWAVNTEKGIANRRALLDAVGAAARKRQADLDSGVAADVANAAYQRTINKLMKIAREAGISEDALKDLVGDYRINVIIKVKGSVPGHTTDFGGEVFPEKRRRAAGGDVWGGDWLVGERGPEVLRLGAGQRGHVYPSVGAARGSGGGQQTVVHVLDVQINGRTLRKLAINDALGRGISQDAIRVAHP